MRFRTCLAAVVIAATAPALAATSAQDEENTRAARAEMQRLVPLMQGRWKGTGSFRVSRETVVATESEEIISAALGGSALLIEGIHRDAASRQVVHHAMGLLAWAAGTRWGRARATGARPGSSSSR